MPFAGAAGISPGIDAGVAGRLQFFQGSPVYGAFRCLELVQELLPYLAMSSEL